MIEIKEVHFETKTFGTIEEAAASLNADIYGSFKARQGLVVYFAQTDYDSDSRLKYEVDVAYYYNKSCTNGKTEKDFFDETISRAASYLRFWKDTRVYPSESYFFQRCSNGPFDKEEIERNIALHWKEHNLEEMVRQ